MNGAEGRISGLEDKVEDVDQIIKEHNKKFKHVKGIYRKYGTSSKDKGQIIGIDQIFNKIVEESFPKLRKGIPI